MRTASLKCSSGVRGREGGWDEGREGGREGGLLYMFSKLSSIVLFSEN